MLHVRTDITNVRIFLLHLRRMKSLVRNMFFAAVMLVYIVSTMGYGVHRCTTDGTASLILLFGESPCEYVHSHMDEHGNSYTHSHAPGEHNGECDGHHEGECGHHHTDVEHEHNGCCSTDVYVITEDQAASEDSFELAPQMILLASSYSEDIAAGSFLSLHPSSNSASLLQTLHPKEAPQAVLCTFRI